MSNRLTQARTLLAVAAVVLAAVAAVFIGGARAATPPVLSDSVRAWNAHAIAALGNAPSAALPGAGQPPQVAAQHLAMTQLAVYDAVNSIHRGRDPYLAGLPAAPKTASLDAAVATAAHHLLVGLGIAPVPALPAVVIDRLNTLYTGALAGIPDGQPKTDGIAAGAAAAAALLAERTGDGRYTAFSFTQGTGAGQWRPTSGVSDPFAWLAIMEPFTLESSDQFRTGGPRPLSSDAYTKEYNEVRALGRATGSTRTQAQTDLANFYTANPVEMFNRAFRNVTQSKGVSLVDEARFYAQVSVSGADSLNHCWDEKEHWSFWRPITAIQNGDADTNPKTVGDTTWTSLVPSPPYSDHTSGYNCITGGYMNAAAAVLGNKVPIDVTNLALGVTRPYLRFVDVVGDTIEARILLGIHFRSADVHGARLGKDVARWVNNRYFGRT